MVKDIKDQRGSMEKERFEIKHVGLANQCACSPSTPKLWKSL